MFGIRARSVKALAALLRGVQYVEDCFSNASLFHKALKEAFEAFCNKQIAGATMAQLMADYCNTLLKKVLDLCSLAWLASRSPVLSWQHGNTSAASLLRFLKDPAGARARSGRGLGCVHPRCWVVHVPLSVTLSLSIYTWL